MSQDDNESQSSNNASEDSSDNEEVMIKQESNYEGQGDHDAIEEENKDQILNDDIDFFYHTKVIPRYKEKSNATSKILLRLLREIINLKFQRKKLLSVKIRKISPVTIYRHYDKLCNKGLHFENKIRCKNSNYFGNQRCNQ